MSFRLRTVGPSAVIALCLASSISTVAPRAHAQAVSDADRKAARDLYEKGASLQVAGKPADAIDAFRRSYQVFPAPTTALHIGQCELAQGHLVEAEEDFRALANAKIPEGSAPAFFQAQEEAKAQLAQISARIPTIKVVMTPDHVSGLAVTVDGQAMNAALVGVARPVNPGTHKVTATAPGYSSAEQSVTVQEKESKDVPLTIKSTGVVPTTGTTTTGTTTTGTTATTGTQSTWNNQPLNGNATVGNNSTWNAPYYHAEEQGKRASPGLYGGGIALIIAGSVSLGLGLIVWLYGGAQNAADLSYGNAGAGTVVVGEVMSGVGVAALAGGIIMAVVGGKRVPITPTTTTPATTPKASWVPAVGATPKSVSLAWQF